MRKLINTMNIKERFASIVASLIVTLMGWTTYNTHMMVVHSAVYEVKNSQAHIEIKSGVKNNASDIKDLTKKIDKNTMFRVSLEAIREEEIKIKLEED